MLFISSFAGAQEVIAAEYFWDTDPGQGSGTTIIALDGNLDEAIEDLFTNAVSIPSPGLHTFNIRIKGLENTWSSIFSYVVNVTSPSLITRDAKVIQAEYFWDTDPGVGIATTILALDGNLDEAIEDLFNGSLASPPAGLHTFNIRVKGQDNGWSNIFSYVVNVGNTTLITQDLKVIQAEYFWDTDPGQGVGTTILALDGNLDEAVEDLFNGSLASPSPGLHTFNLRVKGNDAAWSNIFSYVVNVGTTTLITQDLMVVQAEYFWDTDPGQGIGTTILALDGNLDEAIEDLFDGSVAAPPAGLHTFNLRVKGQDNSWSNLFSYVVNVDTPTLSTRDAKVIQAEYFWDVDPGEGSAIPILASDGNLDEVIEDVFQNTLASTTIGPHLFNIRVKGSDNNWSTTFKYVVNVLDSNSYVSFDTTICAGLPYTVPSGDETYTMAGVYSDTISNLNGFDSIMTITLNTTLPTLNTINPVTCGSYLSPGSNIYTSTGTYVDTIPNSVGCDSIITVNLTILDLTSSTIAAAACDAYTSPSGNYIWTSSGTYQDTITNAAGCDSLLTIHLIISSGSITNQTITSCDSYVWPANGSTYTLSGNYSHSLLNAIGCDSVVNLNLTINNGFVNAQIVSACNNYTWAADGVTYSASGLYSISLFNIDGCDSILTLDLTILNSTAGVNIITACDSYTWPLDGNTYSTSGNYVTTIANAAGCDSVVTLNLTINDSYTSIQTETACDSYLWSMTGVTYTTSGIYSLVLTNAIGCDSSIVLDLTIGNTYANTDVVTACDSYTWAADGNTYFTDGIYTASLLTPEGCDSILNLDLTINSSSSATQLVTSCNSYVWPINGNTYTSSGIYFETITNSMGCDSLITLDLTINFSSASSETITACDSYFWPTNGLTYTNSGTYTSILTNAFGCDSLVTLNLTIGNSFNNTSFVTSCGNYLWATNGTTYSTSGFYTVSILTVAGCDSILNLDLTVNSNSTASIALTECDLYTWPLNGNSYASSGIYFATIPNAAGCDSVVTLTLTITNSSNSSETVTACNTYFWPTTGISYNVSGTYPTTLTNGSGCDSIVTLFLTIGYSQISNETVTACDSYLWAANGNTYTSSGIYNISTSTPFGCDSIFNLNLTIGTSTSAIQTVTACDGYVWPLNGAFYGTSGSYVGTIPNSLGCDSIVTLNLVINNSSSTSISESACESYFWSATGVTYTNSGAYIATLVNSVGCDSSVTLNLTINSGYTNSTVISNCGSYTWTVNSVTYTTSGSYMEIFTSVNGCDSTYNLDLTIGGNTNATISVASCGAYVWPLDGQTYANSGAFVTTIPNSIGCDSIVLMNLTVNSPTSGSQAIATCGSYTWSVTGSTYSSTGSYVGTLTNAAGCDSTVTLNLTIGNTTSSSETLTTCNAYMWPANSTTYTNSGTYQVTVPGTNGCDSTLTLNLTVNSVTANIFETNNVLTASTNDSYEWINCTNGSPIVDETGQEFTPTANGEYAVIVTTNGCSDTSSCITLTTVGIDENHFDGNWSVYPNPTSGIFTVNFDQEYPEIEVTVTDVAGRVIEEITFEELGSIKLLIDEPTGVYFVNVIAGEHVGTVRMIKQ
jgi:hypothetical protein